LLAAYQRRAHCSWNYLAPFPPSTQRLWGGWDLRHIRHTHTRVKGKIYIFIVETLTCSEQGTADVIRLFLLPDGQESGKEKKSGGIRRRRRKKGGGEK
jgi:hypothetical protein